MAESGHHLFEVLLAILGSLILVGLNGFFVAAEFAIVKVRRTRLEELAGQGVKAARISILCVDQLDEYLSATQLGITIVSLALGWIGEESFAALLEITAPEVFAGEGAPLHAVATGFSFFMITLLHVVLGELVPKSMAIQTAEKVALKVAAPLRLFYRVSSPLIRLFTWLANRILLLLGYNLGEETPLSEQELKMVMRDSREDGVITESEAQIITRAFEFSDKRAGEIMVPADSVDFVSLSRPLNQNLAVIRRHMHTRFPVCRDDFHSVMGIVHIKDVWPVLLTDFSNEAFEKTARLPVFVDPGIKQDQLLRVFQTRRTHMAVVRDVHGQTLGLVTLEDILEGLVGDIRDEHGN